jgi:hypothetical protein
MAAHLMPSKGRCLQAAPRAAGCVQPIACCCARLPRKSQQIVSDRLFGQCKCSFSLALPLAGADGAYLGGTAARQHELHATAGLQPDAKDCALLCRWR